MRRSDYLLPILIATIFVFPLFAEDADALREKGIAALKDSQTNPRAIVDAARTFVQAELLYAQAGNDEKSVEMNSLLYWCKKKMTMADIDAFIKGGEAAISAKLTDVEKLAPKPDDAQKWFDRADQFAQKNPSEHLLIAIRFYEVADRFKGSDASLKAQDRSLKEQLQDKSSAGKSTALPTAMHAPENAASSSGTRPIPAVAELKASEKLIQDLFKEEYKKTDGTARLEFVTKLLQQADENKNDAAAEYILLHEARDQAVLGGNATVASDAYKRLRDAFKIDFAATLTDLRKLESSVKSSEAAVALATLFLLGSEDSQVVDNYDQAVRFNSRAEDLLPLIKDAEFKARLKSEIPRVVALRQASAAALAASKVLATKPDDPEANLTAGNFALERGQFEAAFAMLAKGKDAAMADISKRELAPSTDVAEQVKLADAWFDRAEKESLPFLKVRMQERAARWYGNALPAVSGIVKLKVDSRLKLLLRSTSIAKSAVPTRKPINLLSLVDVEKDGISGTWKLSNGVLTSNRDSFATLEIPYVPTSEYDIRLVFCRQEGTDMLAQILSHMGKQFTFSIGTWDDKYSGIDLIDGKFCKENETKVEIGLMTGKVQNTLVQVRNDGVTCFLDGKKIVEYKGSFDGFSLYHDRKLRNSEALGLTTCRSIVSFSIIELTEITGHGKPTR